MEKQVAGMMVISCFVDILLLTGAGKLTGYGICRSGMFAAVASGLYPTIPDAQKAMQSPVGTIYIPDMKTHSLYEKKYARYQGLGAFVQSFR